MKGKLETTELTTSRAQLRTLVCLMVLATALCFQTTARADGLMFQPVGATGEVRAEAQRAILWLRDGQWELSIYPVFNREAGNSAWVVPLPVLPTVSEGSADLFDELETITAPVTIDYCYWPNCCCPGDDYYCYVTSGGEGDAQGVAASVNVWDRGSVGSWDYVVLSSIDGDSLETWLDDNGYILPEGVSPAIDSLVAEGSFFFAAKLAQDADPDVPVTPVTFSMAELEDPTYPLRLTAAGVPDGTMELILWMVTPQDEIHGVANDFDPIIDYHGVLAHHPLVKDPLDCVYLYDYGFYSCIDFEAFGYELPGTFSEPLQEIIDDSLVVTRYAIDLDAEAMADDILFEPTDDPFLTIRDERWDMHLNIHQESTGACYECPDCPDNPDPPAGDMYAEFVEPGPDAGTDSDAGSFSDVGLQDDVGAPPFGGLRRGEDSSGEVGCAVTPGNNHQPTILLLLVVGGLIVARRRREQTIEPVDGECDSVYHPARHDRRIRQLRGQRRQRRE